MDCVASVTLLLSYSQIEGNLIEVTRLSTSSGVEKTI
jgi:hypothetical protein